jgi:succinate dehydrogenase/fumarate reductase cytochrome b subunit
MISVALLSKVQGATGLVFALFLLPHLLNTIVGISGVAAYDQFQAAVRRFYLDPVVEVLVLGSIVLHLLATLGRKLKRRSGLLSPTSPSQPTGAWFSRRSALHSYSGYLLTALIGGHVISCRFDGPAPLGAGVAWVQSVPVMGVLFSTYFIVFGAAGCAHLVIGTPIALRQVGIIRSSREAQRWAVPLWAVAVFAAACAFGVLGVRGGLFTDVPDFSTSEFVAHHIEDKLFAFFR